MKKGFLLALASLFVLPSCSVNSFGKEITNIEDFVTVSGYSDDDFNVVKSNRVSKKSDGAKDTTFDSDNHNAEIYSGDDFVYEGDTKYVGFTIKYDVDTYFLITGDKGGIVSENPTVLNQYRNDATSLIKTDYTFVLATYEGMKAFVGAGSSKTVDGVTYDDISLTLADAKTTLGYTLKHTHKISDGVRTENHYVTLDKTDDKWGIAFYSRRIIDLIDGKETYYVTEYQFSCMDDDSLSKRVLATKNNVTSYSFAAEGVGSEDITLTNDISLTAK